MRLDGLVARVGGLGDRRGQGGDLAAVALPGVDHQADDVEITADLEAVLHHLVQRAVRQPAVAHPGERVEALGGNPIRRSLVAEEFTPAADPVADALALAVGHRPGSADDVDAVLAGERAGPAAHHVVVAAVPVVAEHASRNRVELLDVAAGLAVAGKPEERRVDVGRS